MMTQILEPTHLSMSSSGSNWEDMLPVSDKGSLEGCEERSEFEV